LSKINVSGSQGKFSYAASVSAASGSLEKKDIDLLKKDFYEAKRSITSPQPICLGHVQARLGFSGEQTKTASNGRIEHRIWVDRDNSKLKVTASFSDRELVHIKIYGF
jgi:hypothetical protein